MKSGIYLVTEDGCMNPGTGAFRHITAGMEQLGKKYDMKMIVPLFKSRIGSAKPVTTRKKISALRGCLTDIRKVFTNHKNIYKVYKEIKSSKVDFIYERLNYLDFKGILIAKWLKIPHFYELNGVPHYAIKKFYPSYLNKLVKYVETIALNSSDFVFVVGSWHKLINFKGSNWISIENGIEEDYLKYFKASKKDLTRKVNLVFIGHLMQKNHRPDLLLGALKNIKDKQQVALNLIGGNFENFLDSFTEIDIEVKDWGFLNREELRGVMEQMHIGLIPGGEEYASFMKIFEYGGSRCLVIAPNLFNLTSFFKNDEIMFFEKNDANDFSLSVERVIDEPALIERFGNRLYDVIEKKFTWTAIFQTISSKIDQNLA